MYRERAREPARVRGAEASGGDLERDGAGDRPRADPGAKQAPGRLQALARSGTRVWLGLVRRGRHQEWGERGALGRRLRKLGGCLLSFCLW